jgi:hypothetical protein
MIVIYNRPGSAIAGIGCVVTLIVMALRVADVAGLPFLALGGTWLICDLVYRFRWGGRRLLHHLHGGHLYFIPMWVLGVVLLWAGVQMVVMSVQARRPLPPGVVRPRGPATTMEAASGTVTCVW